MCTTFFKFYKPTPQQNGYSSNFKLVVAFNRDMNESRECTQLSYHEKFKNILCGLDVLTGTTWLAINTQTLDYAMLTNFRTPDNWVNKPYQSRGHLILEFVKINDDSIPAEDKQYQSVAQYETEAFAANKHYKAFNIVWGNVNDGCFKYWHSPNKQQPTGENLVQELTANTIYGMSNGGIDKWHKVKVGKKMAESLIDHADLNYPKSAEQQVEHLKQLGERLLNEVLRDDSQSPDEGIEEAVRQSTLTYT